MSNRCWENDWLYRHISFESAIGLIGVTLLIGIIIEKSALAMVICWVEVFMVLFIAGHYVDKENEYRRKKYHNQKAS